MNKKLLVLIIGLITNPALSDTWTVSSGNNFKNNTNNNSGSFTNNFFRPGEPPKYQGSAGFFDEQGNTGARDIVTGVNSSAWYQSTKPHLGEAGDATNLQNMLLSVDIVSKANELREKDGLGTLKISHPMMAMGQIRSNYSSTVKYTHAPDIRDLFRLGKVVSGVAAENLAADHRCPPNYICGKYMKQTDDLIDAAF